MGRIRAIMVAGLLVVLLGSFQLAAAQQSDGKVAGSASPAVVIGPNIRASLDGPASNCNAGFTNCSQQEPYIGVNPNNPNNIVAAAKDWRPVRNEKLVYIYTTLDGGQNWVNQPITYPFTIPNASDPVVQFDHLGNVYVASLVYSRSSPNDPRLGNYVVSSTNGGLNWGMAVQVDSGNNDKDWLAVDRWPSSPYQGRLYECWWNVSTSVNYCSYSTDRGNTWSARVTLGTWGLAYLYPTVAPDGTVYVFGRINSQAGYSVAKSTDGGVTWSAPVVAVTGADLLEYSNRAGRDWRIYSMEAAVADAAGNLHLVWLDARNDPVSGWDILYTRSTNGGSTWSTPRRLNDDPNNLIRDQFQPAISVAPNGRIDVQWADMRDDPANTLSNIYYTYSTDNGVTFAPSVRVTDQSSDLNNGIPVDSNEAAGDYNGITSYNDGAWLVWADTRSGAQDVYVARVLQATATPTVTPAPPTATATSTLPPTNTPSATSTLLPPTATASSQPTSTSLPPSATATAQPSSTATVVAATPTLTATAAPSPTPCVITFADVPTSNIFYGDIQLIACRGIVNGFPNPGGPPSYQPNGNTRRGEFTKMAVLGFGVPRATPSGQRFTDVPPSYVFYSYIEDAARANVVLGLDYDQCEIELRVDFPCFGPNLNISRAQAAVLVTRAARFPVNILPGQTFVDVPSNLFAFLEIEELARRNIINGAPCPAPQSGLCFRPFDSIRRGEIAKVLRRAIESQP